MGLCCRRFTSNVAMLIAACMKIGGGFPDIEHFEALALRHVEEVITLFFIVIIH